MELVIVKYVCTTHYILYTHYKSIDIKATGNSPSTPPSDDSNIHLITEIIMIGKIG